MKIFAHRGFRTKYPENTLLGFEKALETGCYGIELDVQMSHDEHLVIIHDETVDRTTNGTGAIKDMSLSQIQALDAGDGQHIPTLDEYLSLVQNVDLVTNIELKNNVVDYPQLEEKVLQQIRARHMETKILFSSFNHNAVIKMKALAPNVPCGFLCGEMVDVTAMAALMAEHGVEFLHPRLSVLNETLMDELVQRNIPIHVWTVNEDDDLRRMEAYGVQGLFTDDPVNAQKVLSK